MKNYLKILIIILYCIMILFLNISNLIMSEKIVGLATSQVNLKVTLDIEPPEIITCLATPKIIAQSNPVNFTLEAIDNDRILETFFKIILPNFTNLIITDSLSYTSSVIGEHFLICVAKDYRYNQKILQDNYIVAEPLNLSLNLSNEDGGMDVLFYYPNSIIEIIKFINITMIQEILPNYIYDIQFFSGGNKIKTQMDGVNLSLNNNKYFRAETFKNSILGFKSSFVIETNLKFNNSIIIYNYGNLGLTSGQNLEVWVCHNWSLIKQSCLSEWELIDSVQDKDQQTLTITVTEFSIFGLKESLPAINIIPTIASIPSYPSTPSDSIIIQEKLEPSKEIEDKLNLNLKNLLIIKIKTWEIEIISLKIIPILLTLLIIIQTINYWNIIKINKKK